MESLSNLHKIVQTRYTELENYTKLYNTDFEEKKAKLIQDNKEAFKVNPDSVDLAHIAKNMFYISGFHQVDIRQLQNAFMGAYTLYKSLDGAEEFPEELEVTYKFLKGSLPKQMFTIKNGKFIEIEDGTLDTAIEKYEKGNYFKIFESQILKLLNE